MHQPGTLTVDASIVDQMIAAREEVIKRLEAEKAELHEMLDGGGITRGIEERGPLTLCGRVKVLKLALAVEIDQLQAENNRLTRELARLTESANRDRAALNLIEDALRTRQGEISCKEKE